MTQTIISLRLCFEKKKRVQKKIVHKEDYQGPDRHTCRNLITIRDDVLSAFFFRSQGNLIRS